MNPQRNGSLLRIPLDLRFLIGPRFFKALIRLQEAGLDGAPKLSSRHPVALIAHHILR